MNKKLKITLIIFSIFASFCFCANYKAEDLPNSNTTSYLENVELPTTNEGDITCLDILGSKEDPNSLISLLSDVYTMMRVAAVIIVIVLSMIDFMHATAASDADMLFKMLKKFVRRAIILVVFFLVPTILNLLFTLVFGPGYMCEI